MMLTDGTMWSEMIMMVFEKKAGTQPVIQNEVL